MRLAIKFTSIIALVALPAIGAAQRQQIVPQGQSASPTLSPAIRSGDLLFISGQLPSRGDSTIEGQTKSALEKMNPILAAAGTSKENIVKCTVFLVDVKDFQGMNKAYAEFFPKEPPARSTVVVAALVSPGMKLEVECVAAIPK